MMDKQILVEKNTNNKKFNSLLFYLPQWTCFTVCIIAITISVVSLTRSSKMLKDINVLEKELTIQRQLLKSYDGYNNLDYFLDTSSNDLLSKRIRRQTGDQGDHRKKKRQETRRHGNRVLHMTYDADDNNEAKTPPTGEPIIKWKNLGGSPGYGKFKQGVVTITEPGVYLIYSQMTYFDRSGRWSHAINVDDQPIMKCIASEWGIEIDPQTGSHYNTIHQCYTAAVKFIGSGEKVKVISMYPERTIHPGTDLTFWGIAKLS